MSAIAPERTAAQSGIDPRGPQFAAVLTSIVLIAVLLATPGPVGVALLAVQTVLFATGAVAGVRRTPYAWLFATLVRPRLAAPAELEDPAPPRFAQSVGFAFALVGLVGFAAGLDLLGQVAVALALMAALLNAVFGFCLGCEIYLLICRFGGRVASAEVDQGVEAR